VLRDAPHDLPEKHVDIFFAGRVDHAPDIRVKGLAQLEALATEGVRVDISRERLSRRDFLARCARALIVWSPEGLGWDCFRHYEAALCGAVPLINLPTIRRHAPLFHGVHALYYAVEDNGLQETIRAALADRDRLVTMGQAARNYVLRHHAHTAICDYVVRECLGEVRI
jgi:hypothetical protein